MLARFLWMLVKAAIASLVVGVVLSHFGVTADQLVSDAGLKPEKMIDLTRQALEWALPHVLLGSFVIVPIWFALYIFRPPRQRSE